jgi:hypothetical protein
MAAFIAIAVSVADRVAIQAKKNQLPLHQQKVEITGRRLMAIDQLAVEEVEAVVALERQTSNF